MTVSEAVYQYHLAAGRFPVVYAAVALVEYVILSVVTTVAHVVPHTKYPYVAVAAAACVNVIPSHVLQEA